MAGRPRPDDKSGPAHRRLHGALAQLGALALAAAVVALLQLPLGADQNAQATPPPPPSELAPYRTATSHTFDNHDGTFTTKLASAPINYRDAQGQWQPISSNLVAAGEAGYAWQTEANRFRALFRQQLGSDYLRLEINGAPLALSLAGAGSSFATVLGSQVSYGGAFPGVDLIYHVLGDGLKESLVLNGPSAPTSYVFTLSSPAGIPIDAHRRSDGSWAFVVVERDHPRFVLSAPSIADAAGRPEGAPVTMNVTKSGNQFTIILAVDPVWLHDGARQFPVVLDPTVRIQPPAEDASFDAACSTCLALLDPRLNIGTDTLHVWRSALLFDLGDVPSGASLIDAHLNLYYQGICLPRTGTTCSQQSHQLNVHRIASAWTTSTTSSQPTFDATPITSFNLPVNAGEQWMPFDVTSTVNGWLTSGQPTNFGFLVKRSDEALDRGGPRPPGRRYTADPTLKPYLDVRWSSDGVDLSDPTTIHSDGAELFWSRYKGGAPFQKYEVHRSPTPRFTPSPATLLATITDPAIITYRDITADPEGTFTYKIVANTSPSNERTVTMPAEDLTTTVLQPGPGPNKGTYLAFTPGFTNCTNSGVSTRLFIGSDTKSTYRPLLSFDLSAIPSGAYIAEASLSLWNSLPPQTASTVEVHEVTTPWTEGTGDQTCTGDGATWYQAGAGPSQSWTTPGGDFQAEPTASFDRTPASEPQWDQADITGTVQQWKSGELPNYGVLLKLSDETLAAGNNFAYASDNWWVSPTLRPKLAVTYATTDLEAAGPDMTVTPNPDVPDEPSTDPFDDPTHIQQVGTPDPPPAPPDNPVMAYVTSNGVTFTNNDGRWTIYFNCMGTSQTRHVTVGAGYVARFIDRLGRRVVDDERAPAVSPLAGGLGMFGFHYARGTPGDLSAEVHGDRYHLMEGRLCANNYGNFGPYATENPNCPDVLNCQYVQANVGVLNLNVWFRDSWGSTGHGPGGNGLVRVMYRWRFRPNSVRMWEAVTEYGTTNSDGVSMVKEPKLFAGVAKAGSTGNPNFIRMVTFGGANGKSWQGGHLRGCAPDAQNCGTTQSSARSRARTRWDYGTTVNGQRDGGCGNPATPCFSAVMRGYPPGPIISGDLNGTPERWFTSPSGLDRWAWISKNRAKAFPEDTVAGRSRWSCWPGHTDWTDSRRVDPRKVILRRWEYAGRKAGAQTNPFQTSSTLFHGWEGGNGPTDCEPLMRVFGPTDESWGAFGSFGLNTHWVMQ